MRGIAIVIIGFDGCDVSFVAHIILKASCFARKFEFYREMKTRRKPENEDDEERKERRRLSDFYFIYL